jgi:hypothetical protein
MVRRHAGCAALVPLGDELAHVQQSPRVHAHAGLFKHFALTCGLQGFTVAHHAARQEVVYAARLFTTQQHHVAAVQHNSPRADQRFVIGLRHVGARCADACTLSRRRRFCIYPHGCGWTFRPAIHVTTWDCLAGDFANGKRIRIES